jgi:Fe2+ transport system protein FeoA
MWCIYGIVFNDFDLKDKSKRVDFIRFNGDLAIIYALIALAGMLLTMITIGLFQAIGINIQKFYMENIVIAGAAAAPVVAVFIIRVFPVLTNRIAPLIAAIFSPLVMMTLLVYLIAILVSGKDPYNDRDFLLIFNLMLVGVMGIIVFSLSETSIIKNQKFNTTVLFVLSIISIIIDLIALSAIFYRLSEFGITPNRSAILVSNLLILLNLIFIMVNLFRIILKKSEFKKVEMSVAQFLPVYFFWILIVVFGFPLFFGMK